jgi:hypothetical protein
MATPAADAALLGASGVEQYARERFLARVDEALAITRRVLGDARCPVLPDAVEHAYSDKFALAETTLSAAAASCLQALQLAGLDAAALATARAWAASGAEVTLRLRADTRCAFAREAVRELASPQAVVTTEVSAGAGAPVHETTRTSVATRVTEYFWRFESIWALDVFRGAGDAALPLAGRSGVVELKTSVKRAPYAEAHTQARRARVLRGSDAARAARLRPRSAHAASQKVPSADARAPPRHRRRCCCG